MERVMRAARATSALVAGLVLGAVWVIGVGLIHLGSGGPDTPNTPLDQVFHLVPVVVALVLLVPIVLGTRSVHRSVLIALAIGLLIYPATSVLRYGWDGCDGCTATSTSAVTS